MELTPDELAYSNAIGPTALKREIAEGKHGQSRDSPLWRKVELRIESERIGLVKDVERRRHARDEETSPLQK